VELGRTVLALSGWDKGLETDVIYFQRLNVYKRKDIGQISLKLATSLWAHVLKGYIAPAL
jgi:hypothetical protein